VTRLCGAVDQCSQLWHRDRSGLLLGVPERPFGSLEGILDVSGVEDRMQRSILKVVESLQVTSEVVTVGNDCVIGEWASSRVAICCCQIGYEKKDFILGWPVVSLWRPAQCRAEGFPLV